MEQPSRNTSTASAAAPAAKIRQLDDSAVLVCGGTSGVGLASAVAFAQAGVKRLAVMGRHADRGEAARKTILEHAPRAQIEFIAGDASDLQQAEASAERARSVLGGIDVLVTCTHGSNPAQPLDRIPPADISRLLLQSLLAPFQMSRIVLPWMQAQKGGSIIHVASDSAKLATPGGTILGAAMAAIVMFSRTLAMEAKRHGVRVNAVTPALISGTPLYDAVMADPFMARVFAEAARKSALGIPSAQDVAALIVFLGGPGAGRLTGQAISVNGGMSAA
jgi:2-hydroxycyclohexanecarboxyl-CoA dehydrogenase